MKKERAATDLALKKNVLPALRSAGFKGSFPHLRRISRDRVDLLTFQFDKWGGGFVIEISRGAPDGFTTHWGQHIPAGKLRVWDLHPDQRYRIQAREGGGTDSWFRFDQNPVAFVAQQVLDALPIAEAWWQAEANKALKTDAR